MYISYKSFIIHGSIITPTLSKLEQSMNALPYWTSEIQTVACSKRFKQARCNQRLLITGIDFTARFTPIQLLIYKEEGKNYRQGKPTT